MEITLFVTRTTKEDKVEQLCPNPLLTLTGTGRISPRAPERNYRINLYHVCMHRTFCAWRTWFQTDMPIRGTSIVEFQLPMSFANGIFVALLPLLCCVCSAVFQVNIYNVFVEHKMEKSRKISLTRRSNLAHRPWSAWMFGRRQSTWKRQRQPRTISTRKKIVFTCGEADRS